VRKVNLIDFLQIIAKRQRIVPPFQRVSRVADVGAASSPGTLPEHQYLEPILVRRVWLHKIHNVKTELAGEAVANSEEKPLGAGACTVNIAMQAQVVLPWRGYGSQCQISTFKFTFKHQLLIIEYCSFGFVFITLL
jgi:hypothetical protein